MDRGTCATCTFFAALQTQCRKNPPQAFMVATAGQAQMVGTWPPTREHDWCGAYSPTTQRLPEPS